MDSGLPLLVLACAASLALSCLAILWCALFSSPARYVKRAEYIEASISDCVAEVEAIQAKFVQHKAEISALAEAIEGTLDSVERKRRQISGAASRLNSVVEDAPKSRQDIVDQARARVYGGAA